MRYAVIAKCWDDERKEARNFIIGEFETYMNAELFRGAYESLHNTKPWIFDKFEMKALGEMPMPDILRI